MENTKLFKEHLEALAKTKIDFKSDTGFSPLIEKHIEISINFAIKFNFWLRKNYLNCAVNSDNRDLFYKIGKIDKGRYSFDRLMEIFLNLK